MAKQRLHLLTPVWVSLWLILLCAFFVVPRVNIRALVDSPAGKFPSSSTTSVGNVNRTITGNPKEGTRQDGFPPPAGGRKSISYPPSTGADQEDPSAATEVAKYPFMKALKTGDNKSDPCAGRYIYVHDLPLKFNEAILEDCEDMMKWSNMCRYLENNGFGPELGDAEGVFTNSRWYDTNQFALEVIFNNRMKHHDCLTNDSSLAAAIYVPFYAGFDIARHLFNYSTQVRDALSYELANWLKNTPEWRIMGGKDHFLVAGRVTWAFRRLTENVSDWGDKLLLLPEIKNMSTLLIESSPWHSNDFAIPYPTYFHPTNDAQVFFWQDRMRELNREWVFSFAGAPRPGNPTSIRSHILDECKHSKVCKLLECVGEDKNCHSPGSIIRLFKSSIFCLQPPGDSATRRSTFDSILAGCIPVFFHPASAYVQYSWHLPKNYSKYSVFISEDDIRKKNVSIEERLRQISPQRIEEMRAEVIDLIPKIVYADPQSKLRTFKDAFDIAVEGIIRKVTKWRRDIVEGRKHDNFHEELSWKYSLFEDEDGGQLEVEGPHEWDPFLKF